MYGVLIWLPTTPAATTVMPFKGFKSLKSCMRAFNPPDTNSPVVPAADADATEGTRMEVDMEVDSATPPIGDASHVSTTPTFTCETCGKGPYTTKGNLETHVKDKHGDLDKAKKTTIKRNAAKCLARENKKNNNPDGYKEYKEKERLRSACGRRDILKRLNGKKPKKSPEEKETAAKYAKTRKDKNEKKKKEKKKKEKKKKEKKNDAASVSIDVSEDEMEEVYLSHSEQDEDIVPYIMPYIAPLLVARGAARGAHIVPHIVPYIMPMG